MRLICQKKLRKRYSAAFSLVEVVIAAALIGLSCVSLVVGFTVGFAMVQASREDLRATQIMVQKMETLRLYNWSELQDTNNYLIPSFSEYFNPTSSNGVVYSGTIVLSNPSNLPSEYTNNMRVVTVTVNWTNYVRSTPIVHQRMMQTYAAQNGIQNYVYGQ